MISRVCGDGWDGAGIKTQCRRLRPIPISSLSRSCLCWWRTNAHHIIIIIRLRRSYAHGTGRPFDPSCLGFFFLSLGRVTFVDADGVGSSSQMLLRVCSLYIARRGSTRGTRWLARGLPRQYGQRSRIATHIDQNAVQRIYLPRWCSRPHHHHQCDHLNPRPSPSSSSSALNSATRCAPTLPAGGKDSGGILFHNVRRITTVAP